VYRLAGAGGRNVVTPDGLNRWVAGGRHQRYLTLTDPARLTAVIDDLINAVLRRHRGAATVASLISPAASYPVPAVSAVAGRAGFGGRDHTLDVPMAQASVRAAA
jgi:hypothetical protein